NAARSRPERRIQPRLACGPLPSAIRYPLFAIRSISMCLLVLAWKHHPRYRLILAGNRDGGHGRPAAPPGWWQDDPRILAGRDLKAGGTWLGVARSGRFGVVTNYRDLQAPVEGAPSRGQLVPRFLTGATSPKEFLDDLRGAAPRYSGF